jgi:hypothetical protein
VVEDDSHGCEEAKAGEGFQRGLAPGGRGVWEGDRSDRARREKFCRHT